MIQYTNDLPKSLQKYEGLFCKGDISLLDKNIVAIVGSRRPNAYTKSMVKTLAYNLARRDVYVVSGVAMGVDALAHLGAYPKTIAVMANSLDLIYPKVNQAIIEKMEKNSLVLSEYKPNTKATKWSFVQRNKIVVALAKAVVIAQADEQSGSIHSANFALKQNKPLYVLPQRLEESKGTNRLLSEGKAELIYDIDKFCDKFGQLHEAEDEIVKFCKKEPSLEKCLQKFGDKIYEYELDGKLSIEGLVVRIGS